MHDIESFLFLAQYVFCLIFKTVSTVYFNKMGGEAASLKNSLLILRGATLLPARASEQGNVIGSVRIYIYMCVCVYKKKL